MDKVGICKQCMTKMKINSKFKLLSFFFILGFHFIVHAQHLEEGLKMKLTEMERKRIEKSNDEYNLALKTEDDAKKILNNKTSLNNDKSSIQKKYTAKRLNASSYYSIANNLKIEICHNAIKDFWKNFKGNKTALTYIHSIENMANDSLTKATDFRFNSKKAENLFQKLEYLEHAELLEHRFIPVLEKVLYSYLSYPIQYDNQWLTSFNSDLPGEISKIKIDTTKIQKSSNINIANKDTTKQIISEIKEKPTNINTAKKPEVAKVGKTKLQPNDSSLYGKMAVGEDQIDDFNKFIKKQYPNNYKDYVINFQEIDYSDVNSLLEAWYKYLYGTPSKDSINIEENLKPFAGIHDTTSQVRLISKLNTTDTLAFLTKNGKKYPTVKNKKITKQLHVNNQLPDSINSIVSDSLGFVFKIQIAACRVQLDAKTLKGIYNGSEKINEVYEDNWYKYLIYKYSSYRLARKIKDQIKVPGAFIIAYLNGIRIKITPAIAYKQKNFINNLNYSKNKNLIFRIQIAASKIVISEKYLKNIYNGPMQVDKINEDGWYKYSINCGNDYVNALKIIKNISIPGAFISIYENNKKIKFDEIENK